MSLTMPDLPACAPPMTLQCAPSLILLTRFIFMVQLYSYEILLVQFLRSRPRQTRTRCLPTVRLTITTFPLFHWRLEIHLPLSRLINFFRQEEDGDSRFYGSAGLGRQGNRRHVYIVRQVDNDNKIVVAKS